MGTDQSAEIASITQQAVSCLSLSFISVDKCPSVVNRLDAGSPVRLPTENIEGPSWMPQPLTRKLIGVTASLGQ